MDRRIMELCSDSAFVKNLVEAKTPEEIQSVFNRKELTINDTEAKELQKSLIESQNNTESSELSVDELVAVAGGSITAFTIAVAVGAAIGNGLNNRG